MQCISIPECTQRLSDLANSGGQYGQESEEGEEGEECSEEDCEEDEEGCQEEEVTRLRKMPAPVCRHVTRATRTVRFSKRIANWKALVDERGCRRDIRSNGRIAISTEFALREKRSGRRTNLGVLAFFIRCGSTVRNFTAGFREGEICS